MPEQDDAHAAPPARRAAAARLSALPQRVRIAAPIAVMATLGAVGVGVLTTAPAEPPATAQVATDRDADTADRSAGVSRSQSRAVLGAAARSVQEVAAERREAAAQAREQRRADRERSAREAREQRARAKAQATRDAVAAADVKLWVTTDLNVWATSGADAERVGLLEAGQRVRVTGRAANGREEIVWEGAARWVSEGYLSDDEPVSALGVGGECTNGTSAPSGVSDAIVALHQSVCASFPEITDYGGLRTDGDHGRGLALDIMVSGERGWEIAEFVRANYQEFGVNYVIYAQKIWSVDRSGEGWRSMEDRGSVTANHFDHVHVSVY